MVASVKSTLRNPQMKAVITLAGQAFLFVYYANLSSDIFRNENGRLGGEHVKESADEGRQGTYSV